MNGSFTNCVFRKRTLNGVFTGLLVLFAGYSSVAQTLFSTAVKLPPAQPVDVDMLAGYAGEGGGSALADVWSEKASPFGKLPIPYLKSLDQLTPSEGYSMKGKLEKGQSLEAATAVINSGKQEIDDVVQLNLTPANPQIEAPLYTLKGFKRVTLAALSSAGVRLNLSPNDFSVVNRQEQEAELVDKINISMTGSLPGRRSEELEAVKELEAIAST